MTFDQLLTFYTCAEDEPEEGQKTYTVKPECIVRYKCEMYNANWIAVEQIVVGEDGKMLYFYDNTGGGEMEAEIDELLAKVEILTVLR